MAETPAVVPVKPTIKSPPTETKTGGCDGQRGWKKVTRGIERVLSAGGVEDLDGAEVCISVDPRDGIACEIRHGELTSVGAKARRQEHAAAGV